MTIAALLLAAGSSRRMGAANKLLLPGPDGRAMVLHSLDRLLAVFPSVTIVLGHEAEAVRAALGARPVRILEATDHGDGLSASLRAGIAGLPVGATGVLIALGDMPCVSPETLRALLAAHRPAGVTAPSFGGQMGNPILWDRHYFPAMRRLTGDRGAKSLVPPDVHIIEVPDEGILMDVDTQESLRAWQARP
ncbi:MAG TPA: nucleotidyltransferase family protein [Acidisoma sp.]|uniref:nucleotidyltransferase family protein n=1 Tax=Acidisoma sp. TaxID=1872115 RepID=UPI002B7CE35D|nr:nucleotidyltransferase family protein [Acidisoma sp.]HTI03252.1 nucleotidyltransferase family protein [Acidisoma sp.]